MSGVSPVDLKNNPRHFVQEEPIYLTIQIRDYQNRDAEALWSICFHTIRDINRRDYTQAQVEAWAYEGIDLNAWQHQLAALKPWVAEEINGVIVGYADLQPNGLIDHFFCHHQYQRQGIGQALMQRILAEGKTRKLSQYHAEVSITARPFFEQFGFEVVQTQVVEVRGQQLKNFVMTRGL